MKHCAKAGSAGAPVHFSEGRLPAVKVRAGVSAEAAKRKNSTRVADIALTRQSGALISDRFTRTLEGAAHSQLVCFCHFLGKGASAGDETAMHTGPYVGVEGSGNRSSRVQISSKASAISARTCCRTIVFCLSVKRSWVSE